MEHQTADLKAWARAPEDAEFAFMVEVVGLHASGISNADSSALDGILKGTHVLTVAITWERRTIIEDASHLGAT